MNNFLRTIIAGYGAKKLGGGCFSTILVFIIIYYALGQCNSRTTQTRHASTSLSPRSVSIAVPYMSPGSINMLAEIKTVPLFYEFNKNDR